MNRRHFLYASAGALAASTSGGDQVDDVRGRSPERAAPAASVTSNELNELTPAGFHHLHRFAATRFGRIAYVERGKGSAAVFLHGYPLNGYQWRGALERLSPHRRCIAPDFMGLGCTETAQDQDLAPRAQAEMIVSLLDALSIDAADFVANDSGGAVAQLLAAYHPSRVRSLLLTNCDVHENSPPPALGPFLEEARAGTAADRFLARQIQDKEFARSAKGLGGLTYTNPANFTDELIECYFRPLLSSPRRRAQFHRYAIALEPNPLLAIEPALKRFAAPVRMVWGTNDLFFGVEWADWLDRTLPNSRGVRRVEGAKLFFPEEMPDLIAEEALALWDGK